MCGFHRNPFTRTERFFSSAGRDHLPPSRSGVYCRLQLRPPDQHLSHNVKRAFFFHPSFCSQISTLRSLGYIPGHIVRKPFFNFFFVPSSDVDLSFNEL